jgi:hypothetical protein
MTERERIRSGMLMVCAGYLGFAFVLAMFWL